MRFGPRAGSPASIAAWEAGRLAFVPSAWAGSFRAKFDGLGGSYSYLANTWLRETTDRCKAYRVDFAASDSDIVELAKRAAHECFDTAKGAALVDIGRLVERMKEYCGRWGVLPPRGDDITPAGMIGRMTDALWWRRRLRRVHARGLEGEAIRLGFVHRRAGVYCSDETLDRRQQQKRRNASTLETLIAENELGQQFTLAQLAALSVANPSIRRGELMTRIAGFEAVALGVGHVGEFVTLTCPSEYHARLAATAEENPRYAGHTPRQAQAYLQGVWAKIRAKMARAGVRLYGFRVAEPHHDGCPHWHMLFFMAPEVVGEFREIVTKYGLESSPDEPGAKENRVKFKAIDRARGSAAGYIAKYIAKAIDGHGVGLDLEGNPAIESAMRVDAWASAWGIRQFQQIGGPPVGVWRELRRIAEGQGDVMERARAAADAGNWGAYVVAMGGPVAKRVHLPLNLAKRQKEPVNRYGESGAWSAYGVADVNEGWIVESRRFDWRILSGASLRVGLRNQGGGDLVAGRVTASEQVALNDGLAGGGFCLPWSPVNNCTGVVNEGVRHVAKMPVLPVAAASGLVGAVLPGARGGGVVARGADGFALGSFAGAGLSSRGG